MTTSKIPVTWSALLSQQRNICAVTLDEHQQRAQSLQTERSDLEVAYNFGGVASSLASSAVVLGDEHSRPVLAEWLALTPRPIAVVDADPQETYIAYDVLSLILTAECVGLVRPSEADNLEARWLPVLADQGQVFLEPEQQTLALIAIQARMPELAARFVGEAAQPFEAGMRFEHNSRYFIRYLAQARQLQVDASAVEPAWRQFVELFPFKLAAETIHWIDLLLAGRVLAQLSGEPTDEVADVVHALVSSFP